MRFCVVIFLCLPATLFAQNLAAVKEIVRTMSDSSFHGRGYVSNGSNLAAAFVSDAFAKIGLKPLSNGYFQNFSFVVNTFPDEVEVWCDRDRLRPGKDFILDPGSGTSMGRYKMAFLDSADFQPKAKAVRLGNKIPIIDLSGIDTPDEVASLYEFKIDQTVATPLILLNPGKLTWSVSQQRYKNAIIEVEKSFFSEHCKRISLNIVNKQIDFAAKNVIGKLEGNRSDSCYVITAHYDHLGRLGAALFPGASDNASGIATMLDIAHYFSVNQPACDIYFVAFAGEEAGLVGSKFFVEHSPIPLERIKFLINLDLMGSAAESITIVNGRLYPTKMKLLAEINTSSDLLSKIKLRGKAANSDHYWFSEAGVPSVFIYTEGNAKAYHDIDDVAAGLDWANYDKMFTLLVKFLEAL